MSRGYINRCFKVGDLARKKVDFIPRRIPEVLEDQHPVHGEFGKAYEMLGGLDGLVEWAQSSERAKTQFYTLLTKMIVLEEAGRGPLRIEVHPSLGRSPLDE